MITKCDKCRNYMVSPSQVTETCFAVFETRNRFIVVMDDDYVEQRMNGNKNHCKEFKRI